MERYYVAFYRGQGRFPDRLVRLVTRSSYSHCELIRSERRPFEGETITCISASGRDGGVRIKDITLEPGKWRVLEVTWAPRGTWDRAAAEVGKPYELWSMIVSQLFNLRRHTRGKWFCSELLAYALKLDMPHAYAPGDLLRAIRDHTDTWNLARTRHAEDEDLSGAMP